MDLNLLVKPPENPAIPRLSPGETVKVSVKVKEGDRERVQVFQGVVMKVRGGGAGANFTVRRIASHSVGVERTFLLHSPLLQSVEVLKKGKVRRARLFYLRALSGKAARIKDKDLQ